MSEISSETVEGNLSKSQKMLKSQCSLVPEYTSTVPLFPKSYLKTEICWDKEYFWGSRKHAVEFLGTGELNRSEFKGTS